VSEIFKESQVGGSPSGKWATFYLHGEMFALRVEDVQEVMMDQPLTPVPLAPDHVVGLLNLRGQIMPALDLRVRLLFPRRGEGEGSSLIVIRIQGTSLSLVVDEIGDVLELPARSWRDPPDTLAAQHRGFVRAICPIDRHVVLALNVEALVGDDNRPTHSRAS